MSIVADNDLFSNALLRSAAMLARAHELRRDGSVGGEEWDRLADESAALWSDLSDEQQGVIKELSVDLHSLAEPAKKPGPLDEKGRAKLAEVLKAKELGDWNRALQSLREMRDELEPAYLSRMRGEIWREAGEPAVAADFFRHMQSLGTDETEERETPRKSIAS